MNYLIVLGDGFSPVGGIFATEDHHEAANDGGCGDAHVHLDPEVIASSFHGVAPNRHILKISILPTILIESNSNLRDVSRNLGSRAELATPDEEPLLEGRDGVAVLTCSTEENIAIKLFFVTKLDFNKLTEAGDGRDVFSRN